MSNSDGGSNHAIVTCELCRPQCGGEGSVAALGLLARSTANVMPVAARCERAESTDECTLELPRAAMNHSLRVRVGASLHRG
jgi:hypothetical protein